MAALTIIEEHERAGGWEFGASVNGRAVTLRLSWQDYDLWGRGAVPPSEVARAVLSVLDRAGELSALGRVFDASSARRIVRTLDEDVPDALTGGSG